MGFGLKNIINNLVSGIILIFEGSIKIGDMIELDPGTVGKVEDIKEAILNALEKSNLIYVKNI